MTKWLRKYSKVLLVVAGVILMVGFLIGPAVQRFGPNPAHRVVGYIGPAKARTVRGDEIGLAYQELTAMREFCRPLSSGDKGEVLLNIINVTDEVHWYLLVQEARRAGFVASTSDGNAWISELAQQAAERNTLLRFAAEYEQQSPGFGRMILQNPQFAPQLNPQRWQQILGEERGTPPNIGMAESRMLASRDQIAASSRLTPEQFDQALTKLRGVMRMVIANLSAPAYSDRRATDIGHRLGDTATVDLVFVTGDRLASEVGEPTPEALAAHWQKYRDTMPGTGELGIGYLQPMRVRLAWLQIDRAAIAAAVDSWPVPGDQVLDRWSRNRLQYAGEFTAERPNVERDIRAAKVNDIVDLARRSVVQQTHTLTQRLLKSGVYFVLPPDWQTPDLSAIAQGVVGEIARNAGVTIPLPSVTIMDNRWQNSQDLAALPGIGRSVMRQGATTIPFPQAALSVRVLAGENPTGIQVRVPSVEQPLEDASGNVYFMMVLDARQTGPADSIDEVMDDVRHDYIALQGDALLRSRLDSLRQTAIDQGLDAVAAMFPPENALAGAGEPPAPLTVLRDQQVAPRPPEGYPPPLGDRDFCEAVVGAARHLDPRTPATDQPIDARTIAHRVPSAMGVAIAQITWFTPLTLERYRAFAGGGMFQVILQEWQDSVKVDTMSDLAMGPFTLKALKERWNWVDARPREDREDNTAPADTTAPPGSGQTAAPQNGAPTGPPDASPATQNQPQ